MLLAMKKERFGHIDLLRAFAIVGMIAIHTLQYSLNGPVQIFFWNYLHFVEALFVFCSGYVLTAHYQEHFVSSSHLIKWYFKRITRLLVPFYLYLLAHYTLWILFPNLFSGLGLVKSFTFILQSIFLVGGVDVNWLVLLFVELTILLPIFFRLIKRKYLLAVFMVLALLATVFFTLHNLNSIYRFVMWIPWSLILLFSILTSLKDLKKEIVHKKYFSIGLLALGAFLFLFTLWSQTGNSLRLIDNKYPPNLFYLLYGFGATVIAFIISRWGFWQHRSVKHLWFFVSQNSYQLFFIHFVVLDLVLKTFPDSNSEVRFILIVFVSILVSLLLKITKTAKIMV